MKILVADKMAKEAVEYLAERHEVVEKEVSPEELLDTIPQYDALLVRSRTKVPSQVIDAGANLKVIGRAGIGVDNIDVVHATSKGIPVVNAPRGSLQSVAELSIGMMLTLARGINRGDAALKQDGKWIKKQLKGVELEGKVLGLIGFGKIGQEVAKRALAFNMDIMFYDPYINDNGPAECRGEKCNMDGLLEKADFISIHCLLTDETRGLFSAPEFEKMKDTAYIINGARGGIIDENALYIALSNQMIGGAGLDVFETEPLSPESPLLGLDNIVLTPHIGASTKEAQIRAGTVTAEQVDMVLGGRRPEFCTNAEVLK
jgi:D-3-phosphoglycerate dehydrogenase